MAKEVLLSRRNNAPMDQVDATSFSRRSGGGVGSGGMGAYQPPPISNYKGVMLCDRPVLKQPGKPTHLESGQAMPFSCSIGPLSKFERIGLNPSKEERAARLAMESKVAAKTQDDYFTKHKQWLSQLRHDKRRKDLIEEEEVRKAEERKERFKEYSTKLRQTIRQATIDHKVTLTQETLAMHTNQQQEAAAAARAQQDNKDSKAATPEKKTTHHEQQQQQQQQQQQPKKKETQKSSNKNKPAWAMTERELEEKEEGDVDDLINFASNLDYEKFIDDWEVRSALAAVKKRIHEISGGGNGGNGAGGGGDGGEVLTLPDGDEDWKQTFADEWNREEVEAIIRAARDKAKASGAGVAHSVASSVGSRASVGSRTSRAAREGGGGGTGPEDAALEESINKLAEKVLQGSKELRRIHSSHSVRSILEREGERRNTRTLDHIPEDVTVGPMVAKAPTVVQYAVDDHGGPKGATKPKLDPSNLPYLHRNPAI